MSRPVRQKGLVGTVVIRGGPAGLRASSGFGDRLVMWDERCQSFQFFQRSRELPDQGSQPTPRRLGLQTELPFHSEARGCLEPRERTILAPGGVGGEASGGTQGVSANMSGHGAAVTCLATETALAGSAGPSGPF